MEFLQAKLANGLEIVAECNDEAHTSALGFFVQTGARDEKDEVSGVSHFLEHMVFKGTPKRTADDVNREFDEMGAHYNAFTSEENTVYYAAILPEFQTRAVELLGDILRPSLRQEDFVTEKQVILEEIKMYEDQPPFGADDKCRAAHFSGHPLGKSVLGTVESVGSLPVEKMRQYFSQRYSPQNIVLAASGRIDFMGLTDVAQKVCGDWQQVAANRDVKPVVPRTWLPAIHKPTASAAVSTANERRSLGHRRRSIRRKIAHDHARRRFRQPRLLGIDRSRAGRKLQPAPLRIRGRGSISHIYELRSAECCWKLPSVERYLY